MASLRRNLDYQLDTILPLGSSSYQWPARPRCNNDVRLRASEVGGVATISLSRRNEALDVLLPIAIAADPSTPATPPYRAVLVIGRRAKAVFVSLWHYGAGDKLVEVFSDRLLPSQAYQASGRVGIELSPSEVKSAGLYRFKASVHFEQGRKEALEHVFLHAP
jgi:hypothetical protein